MQKQHAPNHYYNTSEMTSQTCKLRYNGKRPFTNDPVQELSQSAQKRACKTTSQSTLPFAPPPLSPPATQATPPTNPTPCPVDDDSEEELLTEKTIRADERIDFVPDWSRVVDGAS